MATDYREYNEAPAWVPPVWGEDEPNRGRRVLNLGDVPLWSGDKAPPPVGARVQVRINGIGAADVLGYFVEHGWLGLLVLPKAPPAWYVKQNGHGASCHVFGTELG